MADRHSNPVVIGEEGVGGGRRNEFPPAQLPDGGADHAFRIDMRLVQPGDQDGDDQRVRIGVVDRPDEISHGNGVDNAVEAPFGGAAGEVDTWGPRFAIEAVGFSTDLLISAPRSSAQRALHVGLPPGHQIGVGGGADVDAGAGPALSFHRSQAGDDPVQMIGAATAEILCHQVGETAHELVVVVQWSSGSGFLDYPTQQCSVELIGELPTMAALLDPIGSGLGAHRGPPSPGPVGTDACVQVSTNGASGVTQLSSAYRKVVIHLGQDVGEVVPARASTGQPIPPLPLDVHDRRQERGLDGAESEARAEQASIAPVNAQQPVQSSAHGVTLVPHDAQAVSEVR